MVPGVEVFGTPGWLTPLVFRPLFAAEPVVEGTVGVVVALAGGVAGEIVGPAAGDCAAAAKDDPASASTASVAIR